MPIVFKLGSLMLCFPFENDRTIYSNEMKRNGLTEPCGICMPVKCFGQFYSLIPLNGRYLSFDWSYGL